MLKVLAGEEQVFRLIGGGANVLIEDGCHQRPFLHLDRLSTVQWHEDGQLIVGAGYPFLKLVSETVRQGWRGLQGLAGIPGQMGGICAMNAGGRWGEIKDVIAWVEVATSEGEVKRMPREACGFAYRSSQIPGVITRVCLQLEKEEDLGRLKQEMAACLKAKGASQPLKLPSGGCCFANPPGLSVGQIVDELGLKGMRHGDAMISEIHGNFIVNLGQARFDHVLYLMKKIEGAVLDATGHVLRRELQLWQR